MNRELQERLVRWLNRVSRPHAIGDANGLGAVATTIGNVRTENQDRALIAKYTGRYSTDSFLLHALCDGIGGLRDGGICAARGLATILTALLEFRYQPLGQRFVSSLIAANGDIHSIYKENGGCTFSGILTSGSGHMISVNVGDSRIYKRTQQGVDQVSSDDNIGNQLQSMGQPANDLGSFGKQLTQFLGISRLEPKLIHLETGEFTAYFLTSDGVHSLGDQLFGEIVHSAPNLVETARRLTTVAKWGKGNDNATVVCVPIQPSKLPLSVPEPESGLLQIWDSFGSLDVLIHSVQPKPLRPAKQPQFYGGGSPKQQSHRRAGGKKQNRKSVDRQQPLPEVQITENPPQ